MSTPQSNFVYCQWRIFIVKFWTRPPWGPNSFNSCSFWEILAKSYVCAPRESWRPHLGGILDPPLIVMHFSTKIMPILSSGQCPQIKDMNTGFVLSNSVIRKATSLMVPWRFYDLTGNIRSFHHSIPEEGFIMGEWSLGDISASGFFSVLQAAL